MRYDTTLVFKNPGLTKLQKLAGIEDYDANFAKNVMSNKRYKDRTALEPDFDDEHVDYGAWDDKGKKKDKQKQQDKIKKNAISGMRRNSRKIQLLITLQIINGYKLQRVRAIIVLRTRKFLVIWLCHWDSTRI